MKLLKNGRFLPALALTLAGAVTVSCGRSDDEEPMSKPGHYKTEGASLENSSVSEPAAFLLAAPAEKIYCPPGFSYSAQTKLCANSADAVGPFPQAMVDACEDWGGGEPCKGTFWEREMAEKIRGGGSCPEGSAHNSKGLCSDGKNAFGPFSEAHVAACKEKGGGSTCDTMRWSLAFAEWTLPAADKPAPQGRFTFPYTQAATTDYLTSPRNFGAGRSGGRKHAGADLYAPVGRPIYAVGDGTVTDFHEFYDGTYALVIDHGSFVVRYGEIQGRLPQGIRIGSRVVRGQHVASVGLLVSLRMSMLHFERYSGSGRGPLTVRSNWPYQRRSDLVNPTSDLLLWKYPR
jgi:hypothetical protein